MGTKKAGKNPIGAKARAPMAPPANAIKRRRQASARMTLWASARIGVRGSSMEGDPASPQGLSFRGAPHRTRIGMMASKSRST